MGGLGSNQDKGKEEEKRNKREKHQGKKRALVMFSPHASPRSWVL